MEVDLTNCEREPIHQLGHVQSFGCLIALSPDWLVVHASANAEKHLGIAAQDMIGNPLRSYFSDAALHEIRTEIQTLSSPDAVGRCYDLQVRDGEERHFHVAVHRSGQSIIVELERVLEPGRRKDALPQVRGMVERLKTSRDVTELCKNAARFMKALCGFDRVMVYRFAPDIPKQARALYKRSPIRIISDVGDRVSPILPETGTSGEPVDLSLSTLRAVSPIHLEYLRNMGVAASMSVSIMDGDRLWGLFACHHNTPRKLDYAARSACDLFGQMFGFLLTQVSSRSAFEEAERARDSHNALMRKLAEGGSIVDDFDVIVDELRRLIEFDGAIGWVPPPISSSVQPASWPCPSRAARATTSSCSAGKSPARSLGRATPKSRSKSAPTACA